jgi:hypothetical protein
MTVVRHKTTCMDLKGSFVHPAVRRPLENGNGDLARRSSRQFLIGVLLSPQLRKPPLPLNLLIASSLNVNCLTWLILPRVTRWFKPWLNPPPQKQVGRGPQ